MGEAKRRKKLAPGFGKTNELISFQKEYTCSENGQKVQNALEQDNTKFWTGTARLNGKCYPVFLVPYIQTYREKLKLYCHIVFYEKTKMPPKLSQNLINKISQAACKKILSDEDMKEEYVVPLLQHFVHYSIDQIS